MKLCAERDRLIEALWDAVAVYHEAMNALNASRGSDLATATQKASLAKKACEECRIRLQRHEAGHGCRSFSAAAELALGEP